ncbi:MAG TPA: hypothetical protein VN884_04460 [Candidatus Sulfotelmatobacter sp.]|nr:hypothetical protein [Candidatus Sulfotelmatobacter sp.]
MSPNLTKTLKKNKPLSVAQVKTLYAEYVRACGAFLTLQAYFRNQFARDAARTKKGSSKAKLPAIPQPKMDPAIRNMFAEDKKDREFLNAL